MHSQIYFQCTFIVKEDPMTKGTMVYRTQQAIQIGWVKNTDDEMFYNGHCYLLCMLEHVKGDTYIPATVSKGKSRTEKEIRFQRRGHLGF